MSLFSKEPYERHDVLQKRLIIFRSLLIVLWTHDAHVDVLCTFNLYVSFPKEPYERDDVLQKKLHFKEPTNRTMDTRRTRRCAVHI